MKMTSSTSITSTMGVMLMSAMSLVLGTPAPAPVCMCAPMLKLRSGSLRRHILRHAGRCMGKPLRAIAEIDIGQIIDDDGRDCGGKANRGRKQSFGNAGADGGEACVFGSGDPAETVHDAPNRAEKAHKRRGQPTVARNGSPD